MDDELEQTTTPDTGSQLLAEGGNAAAAFVDFQAKLTQIEERILGSGSGEEGENIPLEKQVADILLSLLRGGGDKEGEKSPLLQILLDLAWSDAEKRLFGAGKGEASRLWQEIDPLLPDKIELALPDIVQKLITVEGDSKNPLKTMYENINMLIHGLHILGDNVIPGLEKALYDMQQTIHELQQKSIEPSGAQDSSRTNSSKNTGNCC